MKGVRSLRGGSSWSRKGIYLLVSGVGGERCRVEHDCSSQDVARGSQALRQCESDGLI
jgi:hypothetical protein